MLQCDTRTSKPCSKGAFFYSKQAKYIHNYLVISYLMPIFVYQSLIIQSLKTT